MNLHLCVESLSFPVCFCAFSWLSSSLSFNQRHSFSLRFNETGQRLRQSFPVIPPSSVVVAATTANQVAHTLQKYKVPAGTSVQPRRVEQRFTLHYHIRNIKHPPMPVILLPSVVVAATTAVHPAYAYQKHKGAAAPFGERCGENRKFGSLRKKYISLFYLLFSIFYLSSSVFSLISLFPLKISAFRNRRDGGNSESDSRRAPTGCTAGWSCRRSG